LPSPIVLYEPQLSAFRDTCHALCTKILYLLGVGLEVDPPDFFSSAHLPAKGPSGTTLRFLRYPPLSSTTADKTLDVRAGAHSDYGSVTLLFRLKGQAGLEIQTKDNSWAPVPVSPPGTEGDSAPPILVNIGDLLSYWTNGLFRSTVHRVVFPSALVDGETDSGPRYSIAYFCHPVGNMTLGAVPSDKVKNFVDPASTPNSNPYAERTVMTADEHLQMRLRSTYLGLYKDPVAT
jgi:isopenicillin N synthase-like dioxygenase